MRLHRQSRRVSPACTHARTHELTRIINHAPPPPHAQYNIATTGRAILHAATRGRHIPLSRACLGCCWQGVVGGGRDAACGLRARAACGVMLVKRMIVWQATCVSPLLYPFQNSVELGCVVIVPRICALFVCVMRLCVMMMSVMMLLAMQVLHGQRSRHAGTHDGPRRVCG